MKWKLSLVIICTLFSGCSGMVVDSTPIDKVLFLQRQDSLRIAIYLDHKQQTKYYHINGGDAYIYPALAQKLKSRFKYLTKQTDIIYGKNIIGNNIDKLYSKYDVIIFPDWEIEQINLHVSLVSSFKKYGDSFHVKDKTKVN